MHDPNILDGIGTEWIKNATTTLWSIPLHPSGEIWVTNYLLEEPSNIPLIRRRLYSLLIQLLLVIICSCIFMRNLILSLHMIWMRPRTLSSWCCFITSALGVSVGVITGLAVYTPTIGCRFIVWYFTFGVAGATLCNSIIVLQNAYLVMCKQRWIVYVGIPFMLPQVLLTPFMWTSCPVTLSIDGGCTLNYPAYVIWVWFILLIPINTFFSAIFIYVAHRQYCKFGSDAWHHLARNGTQIMVLVVLCNIICALVILFSFGGQLSEMFFPIDWLISSTLLIKHRQNIRKAVRMSSRPNTKFILRISQIKTASILSSEDLESPISAESHSIYVLDEQQHDMNQLD
ncbi:hypothetical protein BDF22DRAFT_739657 [Syncephalis plumigaleata]|nr:hypothetical protein BDF22DRAFT_739657 [Syncephalis plumigaleata]